MKTHTRKSPAITSSDATFALAAFPAGSALLGKGLGLLLDLRLCLGVGVGFGTVFGIGLKKELGNTGARYLPGLSRKLTIYQV